jgi:predicted Fe-S protein YdhL (DUF1289 family)
MLSPCRKICVYDSLRDLCGGCGRRLEEIENWLEMSEAERAAIMSELPERLKPMPPPAS